MPDKLKSPRDWYDEWGKLCRDGWRDDRYDYVKNPCPNCILDMIEAIQAETYAEGFNDGLGFPYKER